MRNYIDIECIQTIKKLQNDTGQDLLSVLTDIYFMQVPETLTKMKSALEIGDFETLKRDAHSLKSSSATLGVIQIFEICKSLEDETTLEINPSINRLSELVNKLTSAMNPSLDALKIAMRHVA